MRRISPRASALLMLWGIAALAAAAPAPPPQPTLTAVFPAGGRRGATVEATLSGTNLTSILSARVTGGGVSVEVLPAPPAPSSGATTARLRVTIAPDAALGERDLRLVTAGGVTNRVRFVVGDLPETAEVEPNSDLRQPQRISALPAVINGRIDTPEDVDNFLVTARAGEALTFDICGQRLAPAIGKINPGWLETCLTLYDASGRELRFVDDYYDRPDARLTYTFPQAGDYVIQVRDLLYRSHPQFVYRLAITRTDPRPATDDPRPAFSTSLVVARSPSAASPPLPATVPADIRGRIEREGEAGCFAFPAQAGQRLVFEVNARRSGSPLDSVLEILDAGGAVLAGNDDALEADSRLEFTFRAAGTYVARVRDVLGRGGRDYTYCLTIRAPAPDFELSATPDNPRVAPGETAALTVTVNRKEGFAGEVALSLAGLPAGVTAAPATIPANQKQARLTLTAAAGTPAGIAALTVTGTAAIDGRTISHSAVGMETVGYVDQQRQLAVREIVLGITEKEQ